jgi:hypothetical protein
MELKIKLKVKDKEIELTKDEALELKDLLDKLCAQKTEYIPYYPYYPTWTWPLEWWQQPYTYETTIWTSNNMKAISDNVRCGKCSLTTKPH